MQARVTAHLRRGAGRSVSLSVPSRFAWAIGLSILALAVVGFLALVFGAFTLTPGEVWSGLTSDSDRLARNVVWEIRLPRVIDGIIVGASLAVAGVLLQGVTRNPLADPTIMGITAASGLASAFLISRNPQVDQWGIVMACVAGGLFGAMVVFFIAWRGAVSPVRLALAGVALSAFFGAFIVGILASSRTFLQTSLGFLAGGLYGSGWTEMQAALPYLLAGMVGAVLLAGRLNVMSLGDDIASGLGVLTDRTRLLIMAVTGVLTAVAVSIAGLVSFVGLVSPHLARFAVGSDNRYLIPTAALFGAVLVSSADLVARLVIRPAEIPMGIITAAIGAPFLLYLLRTRA
jgi:iron complex transport system permease protein